MIIHYRVSSSVFSDEPGDNLIHFQNNPKWVELNKRSRYGSIVPSSSPLRCVLEKGEGIFKFRGDSIVDRSGTDSFSNFLLRLLHSLWYGMVTNRMDTNGRGKRKTGQERVHDTAPGWRIAMAYLQFIEAEDRSRPNRRVTAEHYEVFRAIWIK